MASTLQKLNPIYHLQKWMDTLAGQTFMQYAYSWGAAVVILGTLFKLTHMKGANAMLFIGMGTEVFVFFIAAFERVTKRVPDAPTQNAAPANGVVGTPMVGVPVNGQVVTGNAEGYVPAEGEEANVAFSQNGEGVVVGGGYVGAPVVGGPVVVGPVGGYVGTPVVGGAPVAGTGEEGVASTPASTEGTAQNIDPEALAAGAGLSAAAANLAAAGQAAASAQLALSQLQNGGAGINPASIKATDPAAIEEAVKNYAEELTELTEVLGRVKVQAARMSTDSEEMENLNRTLTGIATVYELQLRNISKQVSTIEQIDEQTKRMAKQIEELNNVYARMIAALTVNMGGATPAAPTAPAPNA
ncbi:MAG: gliding motility protein GldL [Bacteroidales bacterium]|nr:gliding motility protein GldL [Bacteroidales bacterium]